jgi:hypothetical protein
MAKPSKKEIKQEIKQLKDLLSNIRPYSIFGTDNKAQLAAQIKVLEEDMDNNDIYDEFDYSGIDEEVLGSALNAREWLDGEYEEETLSEDWEGLRQ